MLHHCLCRGLVKYSVLNSRQQLSNIIKQPVRFIRGPIPEQEFKKKTTINYLISGIALAAGMTFAAVPLYRMFCQAYSFGGTTQQGNSYKMFEALVH